MHELRAILSLERWQRLRAEEKEQVPLVLRFSEAPSAVSAQAVVPHRNSRLLGSCGAIFSPSEHHGQGWRRRVWLVFVRCMFHTLLAASSLGWGLRNHMGKRARTMLAVVSPSVAPPAEHQRLVGSESQF